MSETKTKSIAQPNRADTLQELNHGLCKCVETAVLFLQDAGPLLKASQHAEAYHNTLNTLIEQMRDLHRTADQFTARE